MDYHTVVFLNNKFQFFIIIFIEGLMISSLCSTEESVLQLTLASFYPILLMSGIIWPIEAQPLALAQVSKFLPLTFATDAFRCILEKGINFRILN